MINSMRFFCNRHQMITIWCLLISITSLAQMDSVMKTGYLYISMETGFQASTTYNPVTGKAELRDNRFSLRPGLGYIFQDRFVAGINGTYSFNWGNALPFQELYGLGAFFQYVYMKDVLLMRNKKNPTKKLYNRKTRLRPFVELQTEFMNATYLNNSPNWVFPAFRLGICAGLHVRLFANFHAGTGLTFEYYQSLKNSNKLIVPFNPRLSFAYFLYRKK